MYIPPFWCGVAATLLVELVATIVYAAVSLKMMIVAVAKRASL